jgi:hypothetical protein
MSQLAYAWEQAPELESPPIDAPHWTEPPKRSILQPISMLVPVILAAGGYFLAAPVLVDFAFLTLTILFSIFLFGDLRRFSDRFGMGGIVLFAGVLIWFCYDYFCTWFMVWAPHWHGVMPAKVIASAGFAHMIYILCMVIGIRIRFGRLFSQLLTKFPEPPSPSNYFWVVIVSQIIGLMPYFVFTAEPFYMAIYHSIALGRSGSAAWTVGRTGNVNYSYGAYVAQILDVGGGGAILAMFCVIFLRINIFKKLLCIMIWLLWVATGFGTGTRGEIVKMVMPVVAFVFIRYHVQAQEYLHKFSVRAYAFVAIILFLAVIIIQVQIRYRNQGFENLSLNDVSLTKIEGNAMFSSSLIGFALIPEVHDFFYNNYPGQTVVMPIPNFIVWAAIAPMPRAFWTTKPIDPSWKWYNAVSTGRSTLGGGTVEGTTISEGIVGYWYFRFGLPGVIEGGLFMGWLMGIIERALYNNNGRPFAFFAALALLTWMFRTYRDADLQDLADAMVVLGGLMICLFIARPFLSFLDRD